ncbi:alpha/beta fold hydrolase [uncultured Fibrella sp.]|uniref:alpha/beta fold hydrolase n=1 Tax=uncultured Fibrella sp. TaxID=1284596 RepID=UPI0035CA5827
MALLREIIREQVHYVQTSDARLYYEVYGKGSPVVILHGGIMGSTYEMVQLIDSLSKSYRVIAMSAREHGKSEIGTAPLTYEQQAVDVQAVIRAVTQDSVIVPGFSAGAYAGYKLASMYPATVRKLIAIGAAEMVPGPSSYQFTIQQVIRLDSLYWTQQLALVPEPQRLSDLASSPRRGTWYSY